MKTLGLVCALLLLGTACRHRLEQVSGGGIWTADRTATDHLVHVDAGGNGIEVGEPKIYDDSSLRLMLDQARQRLAAVNAISETNLTSRYGALSGATIDQSQFGIQASGPGLPQTVTTDNSATRQTTVNTNNPSTMPSQVTVSTAPVRNVVTTASAVNPPAPPSVPTGIAFTAPGGFSVSALDALNEQMQLTYELTNLQLLLEGSLSDRFVKNERFVKPRTTIGFPITITPRPEYKNLAAVVEVEVTTAPGALNSPDLPEPPAITALLPREKTYNVAAIKDRMTSIGGGAVVGLIGVSGSFIRGRKSYFLVRDQDTVAIQRPTMSGAPDAVAFAWEFKPVLGQPYVTSGLKQTFVQLAFPVLSSMGCVGSLRVRTYWRRYDTKSGVAGALIPETVLVSNRALSIPVYDLKPFVEWVSYEDLGDGTLLVEVRGKFLAGTYVQFGPRRFDNTNGLLIEERGLKFVVSASSVAKWTGQVIARNGESTPVLGPIVQAPLSRLDQYSCGGTAAQASDDNADVRGASPGQGVPAEDLPRSLAPPVPVANVNQPVCRAGPLRIVGDIETYPVNDKETRIRVSFAPIANERMLPDKVLLEVGGKVFGLSDTVMARDDGPTFIEAVVPTALLLSNPLVRAFVPFYSSPDGNKVDSEQANCYEDAKVASGFDAGVSAERIVLISVDKSGDATYLLYGNGLVGISVVSPAGVQVVPINAAPDRIGSFTLTKDILGTAKNLVLLKQGATIPIVLDIPASDTKPQPPKVTIDSPIVQNTDVAEVQVDKPDLLTGVKMADKSLPYEKGKGSSIRLTQLKANQVTTEQREVTLSFEFGGVKVPLKFEVVAARIGVR